MKITNKLCLSVASALLFFGLCTYPAVSLNASQTTVKSQSTTSSTEAVSLKAPYFTVTPGYKSAQITWKAVTGANKYKLFCSDGRSVKFKKAGTYTFNQLNEGQTYTFTVKAFAPNAKTVSRKLSATIPVTISQNVTGLSVYASNSRLNLKWNTLYNASGYSVYIKKGSSYTLLANTTRSTYQTSIASGASSITFMERIILLQQELL